MSLATREFELSSCRAGGGGKRVRGKPAMDQYYGIVLVLLYFAL